MPAPHHLSRKLQDTLGTEASDAMSDWMNQVDSQRSEVRHEIAALRRDMRADMGEVRQELHREVSNLREEMRVGFAKVDARFAESDAAAERRHADFMKWTMGFWAVSLATMMGGLAALARILR